MLETSKQAVMGEGIERLGTRRVADRRPVAGGFGVTLRGIGPRGGFSRRCLVMGGIVGCLTGVGLGQIGASKAVAANPLAQPPRAWAAEACDNEIPVIEHRGSYLRYRLHVIDEKGNQLRDVIESRDGTVARLIQRDGRALTDEQDRAEHERLNDLLASPAAYQKHINADVTGKKRAAETIHMLPDAMLFSYTAGQPQLESPAGQQVVIDFKPNPEWKPPTLPAEGLTGLQGRVWIDVKTRHMVRMEGEIFQSINLGWGMLAHIYPGGRLALDQTVATPERWIFARFSEEITVRALMVKTIHQSADISSGGYQTVAAMSYQDAIRMLLASPLPK